jgi:hypothetical protein
VGNEPRKTRGDWLNVHETAQALGLHSNTVKKMPPEYLPYMRVNSRGDRKYHVNDVEAYIARRMVRG